ncbi:lipid kinase, YegS/Rv2252/BmrU family protein [Lyngbya aestuarii BL J]|uniref:Lipid kinase, YegS/Rv2252/BmrU family protein n=1 Tax=Lyngbya aestuarii BL J TaxID=1348334 RepID=U7QEA8_9CYAN|nr:lipid kinase, YegS/Rv2252/BmrU family protein [Lyngbya aestuarii BL J]
MLNPYARQANPDSLSRVVVQLQALGLELVQESPQSPQDFTSLIERYQDQVDLVIVGGGDGTLNAAIDGLVKTGLPLGILPLGTANDLARTLNLPLSLPEACQVIAQGNKQYIDLGWVNGKHFFNVASLGLSVNITRKLTREAKRRWGIFAYLITATKAILKASPFVAEIRFGDQCKRVKTFQIAVGNGRYYGGGMKILHDATIDDQRLDLYSLEIKRWWQFFTVMLAIRTGRHRPELGTRTLSGSEFEIFTSKPQTINTDGELTVSTPAHFRVIPKAIAVFAPRRSDSNLQTGAEFLIK